MGLFYKAAPAESPVTAPAERDILAASESPDIVNARARTDARVIRTSRTAPAQELSLARLGLAVGFLIVLLVVGLIASAYKIQPWDSVLPSAFQLLVGAVVGAVIGEKIGNQTQ
jgi:hypothetical protein